jgi:hypothetical protein
LKPRSKISVIVLDDPGRPGCEARCGLDLSSAEVLRSTAEALRRRFGSRVELHYTSLDAMGAAAPAGIAERLSRGDLALPLLLVNGQPRISGRFDLHSLQEVIQAEIEMAAP